MKKTDYLIIGSGVAGLTLAIKLSEKFPNKQISIVTKSKDEESNTKYAQGGIAIVTGQTEDSCQKHINDTLVCGDGLCEPDVVEMVIKDGPKRLNELIEWGAKFDKNNLGTLDLGKEGGHSDNRVVHHKDQTGYEIEKVVLSQTKSRKNISLYDYHFVFDLLVDDNCCRGALVLDEKTDEIIIFSSNNIILATGGIGQVYGHTTNPGIATGDGIAMANRINAKISDMEFIQFHPTALYSDAIDTTFLISEAVRGFGAYLRTKKGERFMLNYDSRAELASRDIVSRCIDLELKKSGEPCVYMDCTHLDMGAFRKHFPMIYEKCAEIGIDLSKDRIPVAPSQHYTCGGISVNKNGQTSVENLFACGECSRTGLHGANRLASNSLLEALVYAHKIYEYLTVHSNEKEISVFDYTEKKYGKSKVSEDFINSIRKGIQKIMLRYAGIVRTDAELLLAKEKLGECKNQLLELERNYKPSKYFFELKNIIEVGLIIVDQSLKQTENKGCFMKQNTSKTESV